MGLTSFTIISSDSEREAARLGFGHPQVSEEDKITSQWAKPAQSSTFFDYALVPQSTTQNL